VKARHQRSELRSSQLDPAKEFSSFWEQEMSIGERPTQDEILKAHITNWKSLNLKQRKIILGFLNARRAKDAKSSFVKELRVLGQRVAEEEARSRES
jgi:large subunit ribosomal protein L47